MSADISGGGLYASNFRTSLLDYLRVTTSVLNITSLTKLKEAVEKYEDNCTDACGRKVKLDIQRIAPSSSKPGSTL
jgi:hypothetical protein